MIILSGINLAEGYLNIFDPKSIMSTGTNTDTLAEKLGVIAVPVGKVINVENRTVEQVVGAIEDADLEFLGRYDRNKRLIPQENVYYFNVDGQLLGAIDPKTPAVPATSDARMPPKPNGYKDGGRWFPY